MQSNGHAISCSIGHATRLLKREDTKDIREDVALNGRLYTFAAVFDGHGGAQAAEFCAQHMISYIEQAAQASPSPEGQIRDLISASQVCAAKCPIMACFLCTYIDVTDCEWLCRL